MGPLAMLLVGALLGSALTVAAGRVRRSARPLHSRVRRLARTRITTTTAPRARRTRSRRSRSR